MERVYRPRKYVPLCFDLKLAVSFMEKYICSCSFGKDSLAMLLRLLKEKRQIDEVIFFDTGMEFNSIYHNRDRIKAVLETEKITYTELRNANPFIYYMLVRPVKYKNREEYHYGYSWCGGPARWATTNKVGYIQKHIRSRYKGDEVHEYVGIAYDEPERIKDDSKKIYPLVEWQMTQADCLKYCYDNGYDWNENGVELYSILDRVSCWCCQNKNLKELKNMYLYLPEYWQRLRGLQSRISEPMKGKGKSIFELEERFKLEGKQLEL